MLYLIDNILSRDECAAIAAALLDGALWIDGKNTAAGRAKQVKQNRQSDPAAPPVKGALEKVERALRANALFMAAAQPRQFVRKLFNQYSAGMAYGDHVDAPYVDGERTDLYFTVFLSDPKSYEGGALVINSAGYEDTVKGEQGSVALYPSSYVHRVESVASGNRLCCIGWIKSRIKSSDDRALLFELEAALADLMKLGAPDPVYQRLSNIRNNLLRRLGD